MMRPIRPAALAVAVLCATWAGAQAEKTRAKVRMAAEGEGDARLACTSMMRTGANGLLVHRQQVDDDGVVKGRLDLYDRAKLGFLRTQPPVEKLGNGVKVVPDKVVGFGGRTIMIGRTSNGGATGLHYQLLEPGITKLPPPYEPICSWPAALPAPTATAPGRFDHRYAPDSSLLLLTSPMEVIQGGYKVLLAAWAKDLSLRWQQALAGADKALRSMVLDAAIDTSGHAYVLVSDRMAPAEVVDGQPTTRITLYRMDADSVTIIPIPLPKDHFMTHGLIRHDAARRLVLAGVYGTINDDKVVAVGDLIAMVGPSGVVSEPRLLPHPAEGGLGGEGGPLPVKGQKFVEKDVQRWMGGVRLVDMLPRAAGGCFLVKESYFMESYFDLKDKRTKERFIHGPVQATAVNKAGTVEWNSMFRRWHKSSTMGVGDVLCGTFADELFLFILDSDEQAEARRSGGAITEEMVEGPFTAHVTFDAKGMARAKPVLRGGDGSGFIQGRTLQQLAPGEFYTFGGEKPEGGRTLPVRIDVGTETR